jgi:hypothetical protein
MVMRQFDVVRVGASSLAVILQADLLDTANTCVVAPLILVSTVTATERLHPKMTVKGRHYFVAIEKLTAVHRKELGKVLGSMKDREWDIRRGLDLVFVGV